MNSLGKALFEAGSVALIGASNDPAKNTARPLRYLRKHGYRGRVYPINPKRDEVLGERAYPSLAAISEPIEHALIMLPAAAVAQALRDCAAAGIGMVTIFSDGFAESGEAGRALQQQILAIARDAGIRLLGPNSIGVINTHNGMALSVNAALELDELQPGALALVSQSGSLLGTLLSRGQARGIGFSRLISVGNEADVGVGEIVDCLVDDPNSAAILLFLESIRDAGRLAAAARRAFAAGKPVIVYKLGRSDAGQALAVSHTGAIAGDDAVADAFLSEHGMLRVDMLETLFELPLLAQRYRPVAGKRVAVLTTTGGGAALVVDRLGSLGIEPVAAPPKLVGKMAEFGLSVGRAPIIDLTLAGARKGVYAAALQELLDCRDCDAVIAVVGSSGQFHPQLAIEPIVSAANSTKPLAVFIAPQADRSLQLLYEAGIAAFRTPEACADGVRALLEWRNPADSAQRSPDGAGVIRDASGFVLPHFAGFMRATTDEASANTLDEQQCREVFEALGIEQPPAQIIGHPEQPATIGFPLAAKILSADIAHKTEVGGVVLNIADAVELRVAARRILDNVKARRPRARIRGILLQRMQQGLVEVLIGYRRSALGPTITLGMGGTLAEIYRDFSLRMAPVDLAGAQAMIGQVRGLALIRGYRSLARGDCAALAQALCALSRLAEYPEVAEAEINPLIVRAEGEGVIAVDGLIVLKR